LWLLIDSFPALPNQNYSALLTQKIFFVLSGSTVAFRIIPLKKTDMPIDDDAFVERAE
jgi:hypothetical protein